MFRSCLFVALLVAALPLSARQSPETPPRQAAIASANAYATDAGLEVLAAGGNAMRRAPYAPLLSDAFSHVSPCYPYRDRRDDESEADYVARLADEVLGLLV